MAFFTIDGIFRIFFFLFFFFFFFFLFVVAAMESPCIKMTYGVDSAGAVATKSPLVTFLERVQECALKTYGREGFDAKVYVDMSLKHTTTLSITEKAFKKLPKGENGLVSVTDLNGFIDNYLNDPDNDLVNVKPVDFVDEPQQFLPKVKNPEMRAWALEIHSLWKNLSRKVSDTVFQRPDFHTLLVLDKPAIVPGSRFRELYYWDSYWVIRGLLASKMYETAKGVVSNLISLIDRFGYVLNGSRAYYTNRSQPPLLSSMVFEIYSRTRDNKFVITSLPALVKEYEFWNSGIHKVSIQDAQGLNYSCSRYYAMWNEPRPESSTIDQEKASKLADNCDKTRLYREIASAAESGWDFSTRWMRNESDFTTLATTSILPVDLNVFILKMEIDIAFLANVTQETRIALRFTKASRERQKAIKSIFWNDEMGQWLDYWLTTNTPEAEGGESWAATNQNQNIYASNFIPLWINLLHSDDTIVEKVVQSLETSGLLQPAGIATSLKNSGQQWDFPNGWAPIQHMIVEGLAKCNSEKGRLLAQDIAIRWIRTNYAVYKKTGTMHEKFDVQKSGEFGGGGEYIPQTGFGWSNGVVLAFLEEFGWPQDLNMEGE